MSTDQSKSTGAPINNDQLKNNRREVLLSRRLASVGFAVQRFYYAGTDSSGGAIDDLSVESMIRDTSVAAAHLQSRASIESPAFMGTRLGALPAAAMAASNDTALALWEPMALAAYFRELFRAATIAEMSSDGAGATLEQLKSRFEAEGRLDVTGFTICQALKSAKSSSVPDLMGSGQAPVFLAQFRNKPELRREYVDLVDTLESGGRSVTWRNVLFEEAWMFFVFGFRAEEDRTHSQILIDDTVQWFEGLAGDGAG